jgi:hypothetical protein
VKAVQGRDIPAAGQAYAQCTNPSLRTNCSGRAAQLAPKLAREAAYRGDCVQAKAIIAAASLMGVPDSRLTEARSACK